MHALSVCRAGEAIRNYDWILVNTPGETVFVPAAVLAAADRQSCRYGRLSYDDVQSTLSAFGRS